MLYIHELGKLNPKTADIESVYLIRELKTISGYPLDEKKVKGYLAPYLISLDDKKEIEAALALIQPTLDMINEILQSKDPDHEPINVQRAIHMLLELPQPLTNNILFFDEIMQWQSDFLTGITPFLNSISKLHEYKEKFQANNTIKNIFEIVLRNTELQFKFDDIISEAQKNRITDLNESLSKGFLFHISLEEEINKIDFSVRKNHIALEKLKKADEIAANVVLIKRGIEKAYLLNMHLVNLALILYAYVKWMQQA